MIEWEVTDAGFRVVDVDGAELPIRGDGLDPEPSDRDLPRPVDLTLDCTTERLSFPAAVVHARSASTGEGYELGSDTQPLDLPEDEYLVDVDAEIKVYLRIEGAPTLRRTADYDRVICSLPTRRPITIGLRSRHRQPADAVTVPATPTGVATAITHASSSHKTNSPNRSYPSLRGHPPMIELGDTTDVPRGIRESTTDTGIELLVPSSLEPLLVCAPLAYYLGADVAAANVPSPILRATGAGVEHELSPMPDLERDATRLLRRVFFLDCLVRNVGPYGTDLAEGSLLDALRIDPDPLYDAAPAERLAAYLDVPHGAIEQRLPDWHLSTYVEPDEDGVGALPLLLDRMSAIYMPRTSELEGADLVERSLDDFYRGQGAEVGARTRSTGEVASVDVVEPELRGGRIHGWLAEGTPIDVFRCLPVAYEHHLRSRSREDGGIEIAVVLNDEEMSDEHADVAEIYRTRGEDVSIDVEVHERLVRGRLARLLESDLDFVHFIGHCETGGLCCPDGTLPASSLDRCGPQTFFLNACGSYHEGTELVRRGAVAGAVTFSQVLNDHAVAVGSTFARLLVHGFGFERALQLARRRIMMGKDYAVVGDGTHALARSENRLPATASLEETDAGYLLTYDQFCSRHAGSYYRPYVGENRYAYLCGNESEFLLDREDLLEFLDRAHLPVIFDGDVYWSTELRDRLAGAASIPDGE